MRIDKPETFQLQALLSLWKQVFGEYDGFWEVFLNTAFRADHCRCITENGAITAALYWFDSQLEDQKIAYIYAVATHPDHRGRGLCRKLMADTHAHLAVLGYDSVLLVPEGDDLRRMYGKMGYENATGISEFSCAAGTEWVPFRAIGETEYAALRRQFLPSGGVLQEGDALAFLSRQAQFYAGGDFLVAAYKEDGMLHALELLGNAQAAPGILAALGCRQGTFRIPGEDKPFAMFHPLKEGAGKPRYFAFAFD